MKLSFDPKLGVSKGGEVVSEIEGGINLLPLGALSLNWPNWI